MKTFYMIVSVISLIFSLVMLFIKTNNNISYAIFFLIWAFYLNWLQSKE